MTQTKIRLETLHLKRENESPKKTIQYKKKNEEEIYQDIKSVFWFHSNKSREEAEILLEKNGAFLVRTSHEVPSQYILSGKYNDEYVHILLIDNNGKIIVNGKEFDTISKLVEYHVINKIELKSNNRTLLLEYPISKMNVTIFGESYRVTPA